MERVQTILGTGILKADGIVLGRATYEIHAYSDGLARSASGWIDADPQLIRKASAAGKATLVRDDIGYEMTITISSVDGGAAEADILVSGSVAPERSG